LEGETYLALTLCTAATGNADDVSFGEGSGPFGGSRGRSGDGEGRRR